MATRIYVLTPKGGERGPEPCGKRLVRASNPAQAIRHVMRNSFSATVARQDELVRLLGLSVKVEDAGAGDA